MTPPPVTFEDLSAAQQRLGYALDSYKRWQAEVDSAMLELINLMTRFRPTIGDARVAELSALTDRVKAQTTALAGAVGANAGPQTTDEGSTGGTGNPEVEGRG